MNPIREAPTPVAITQSDTTVYDPPLYGVVVLATGNLSIVNEQGETITRTFPTAANGGGYPFTFVARIRQVLASTTTLTDAEMIGLR